MDLDDGPGWANPVGVEAVVVVDGQAGEGLETAADQLVGATGDTPENGHLVGAGELGHDGTTPARERAARRSSSARPSPSSRRM